MSTAPSPEQAPESETFVDVEIPLNQPPAPPGMIRCPYNPNVMSVDEYHCGLAIGRSEEIYRWMPHIILAAFLLAFLGCICGALTGARSRRRLQSATLDRKLDIIMRSLDQDGPSGKLAHPFIVIRAQDFLTAGRLVSFEETRRSGQHIVLDTIEQLKSFERKERIIFFSHQARPMAYNEHHAAPCFIR